MAEIFSSTSPFNNLPFCGITPSGIPPDLTYGIDCPPSGCGPSDDVTYTFLNCYIQGVSAKLGVGGSESTVTVDLIDPVPKDCDSAPPSGCPPEPQPAGYSGSMGSVYSIQIGGFSFRGILTNHEYQEGPDGFRYRVTLSDGRNLLNNVNLITGGYYGSKILTPFPSLNPGHVSNLINLLAKANASVADNINCGANGLVNYTNPGFEGDGTICKDFGKAGATNKGMYAYRAIEMLDMEQLKIPISNLCLSIDLALIRYLINKGPEFFNKEARIESNSMTALELIEYALDQSGYAFYTTIIDDSIIVVPINQKLQYANADELFKFMNDIGSQNIVIDRDYGQEMTFNKSKKLLLGAQVYYMLSIDYCNNAINPEPSPLLSPCSGLYPPGAYEYSRIDHDYFSGGGTIISDAGCTTFENPGDGGPIV